MKLKLEGDTSRVFMIWVDLPVLSDHKLFSRRLSVWMSRCGIWREDIFLEEALFHKLLQVLPEGPVVDGLVFFAFVVGSVFLRPRERRIMLE